MIEIQKIDAHKGDYMPLLLLSDPSETMVANYLERGDLFVLFVDGTAACVAVVTDYAPGACELKNLATAEPLQNQGYAGRMLHFLFDRFAKQYAVMYVGTSRYMTSYYRRFGFVPSHVVERFFVDFYPEPIFENGDPCIDMLYLKRNL